MTDYRPPRTTPPQTQGGKLWAVLVGTLVVVAIIALFAWWWSDDDAMMADTTLEDAPVAAPAEPAAPPAEAQ